MHLAPSCLPGWHSRVTTSESGAPMTRVQLRGSAGSTLGECCPDVHKLSVHLVAATEVHALAGWIGGDECGATTCTKLGNVVVTRILAAVERQARPGRVGAHAPHESERHGRRCARDPRRMGYRQLPHGRRPRGAPRAQMSLSQTRCTWGAVQLGHNPRTGPSTFPQPTSWELNTGLLSLVHRQRTL